jgi:hypothetical protein
MASDKFREACGAWSAESVVASEEIQIRATGSIASGEIDRLNLPNLANDLMEKLEEAGALFAAAEIGAEIDFNELAEELLRIATGTLVMFAVARLHKPVAP